MEDGEKAEGDPEEGQLFASVAFCKWTNEEMSFEDFQMCLSNNRWIYDVMSLRC